MIRAFSVENFFSIGNKQELNFTTKGPESDVIVRMPDGAFIYKLGILFGANASGKSNMLIALNQCLRLLINPETNANFKVAGYYPFELKKGEPIKMTLSFYADNIRYDYKIVYNEKNILYEELNYFPKGTKALFYERKYVGENLQADIKFGSTLAILSKTQESIKEYTLNNHSVLSVCNKNVFKEGIEPFTKLHSWIINNYHEVDGDTKEKGIIERLNDAYNDPRKHRFYCKMLEKADLNIHDFRPITVDRSIPDSIREVIKNDEELPDDVKETLLKTTKDSIMFENHAGDQTFDLPINWQSKGTLKYIKILDVLYDLLNENHVYSLDELGEDLHYDLLFFYLNVFIFNSFHSQLIITSQETSLLAQELINDNRGLVWFVDKNPKTAYSEYYRGDSFGLHKNLSLYNSYRIGRLGAKPDLGSIFIDLD